MMGLLLAGFFSSLFGKKSYDPTPSLTDNFGTASFAPIVQTANDLPPTNMGVFLGKASEPARKHDGIDGPGMPVVTSQENHTLIVARTRTGKGTRIIVPTMLRYEGNMFVIDPKGENAAITARTRRDAMQQNVHIINPWGVLENVYAKYGFTPATYNPLDILDRNDRNAVSIARRFAEAICPRTGQRNEIFWQQSAANILSAVFLWLTDQPGEVKTLARAREIVSLSREALLEQYLVKMVASSAFDGAIRELVGNLIDLADQTFTGITAHLAMSTGFISDPQLKQATNTSTFNMSELRYQPSTIFLVIPPDQIEIQKTWLRMMIASATQSFRGSIGDDRARRCMMLIDEFPALGKLQDLPTDIATMSGYGIDYTLVIQGIEQLKSIYEKDSGAILNNCAYQWFCNVTDLESAKHLSDSLGETTVHTFGKSQSWGSSGSGATSGESYTWGEKGRKLLTPDEIINMGRDVAVAFQPNGLPNYLKPIDYWDFPKAFEHIEATSLNGFQKLTYDSNPYVKGKEKGIPRSAEMHFDFAKLFESGSFGLSFLRGSPVFSTPPPASPTEQGIHQSQAIEESHEQKKNTEEQNPRSPDLFAFLPEETKESFDRISAAIALKIAEEEREKQIQNSFWRSKWRAFLEFIDEA